MLFIEAEARQRVHEIFRSYALEEAPDEPGAEEHRFRTEPINYERGAATGYVVKYMSKNIDEFGLDSDLYGKDAKTAAERVEAWASCWGIRQFQQFGGPPVGVWRELRRISRELAKSTGCVLEQAFDAADTGDWARYIEAQGGPNIPCKAMPVQMARAWNDKVGRYEESLGFQVSGIQAGNVVVATRIHEWTIRHNGSTARPWSPVNNCTFRQVWHEFDKLLPVRQARSDLPFREGE